MGIFTKLFSAGTERNINQNSRYREIPENRVLRYKVKGRNPETNRQKTVKNIILGSWQTPSDDIRIDGIEPPYEFILDLPPLTDNQKAVFKRNNVRIPKGMHKEDATVVIMHIVTDDKFESHPYFEPPLPMSMLEEAVQKQMFLPSFRSKRESERFLKGKEWRIDL